MYICAYDDADNDADNEADNDDDDDDDDDKIKNSDDEDDDDDDEDLQWCRNDRQIVHQASFLPEALRSDKEFSFKSLR